MELAPILRALIESGSLVSAILLTVVGGQVVIIRALWLTLKAEREAHAAERAAAASATEQATEKRIEVISKLADEIARLTGWLQGKLG